MKKTALKLGMLGLASLMLLPTTYASANSKGSLVSNTGEITQSSKSTNYAYLNYESASDAVKKLILEERKKIVYGNKAWTIDGKVSVRHADGTIEKLPEFKDLFPNWDPRDLTDLNDLEKKTENDKYVNKPSKANTEKVGIQSVSFADSVSIPLISGKSTSGNKFYYFNAASDGTVSAWASTLPGKKINIGFTNEDTKKDQGWVPNLKVDEAAGLDSTSGVRYSVRCSSFDKSGWGYLNVEGK